MMSARLDQKISIESVTTDIDGMGATTETWAAVPGAPAWAQYIPLRGAERIEAGKVSEKEQFKLRIRRCSAITRTHRVVFGGKNYDIVDIEDGQRMDYMVLFCREAS